MSSDSLRDALTNVFKFTEYKSELQEGAVKAVFEGINDLTIFIDLFLWCYLSKRTKFRTKFMPIMHSVVAPIYLLKNLVFV